MKYWAFVSYSHADKAWGDWLHKSLETYRVPKRLVGRESRDGKVPPRLFPIFRDREELPVSSDLSSNINEALNESRYLIVICSPRSAQSLWVGEEIKTFKRLGREDRILALIVAGEPNASEGKLGFTAESECFPEALRFRWSNAEGKISDTPSEPIAADAREGKDEKNNAKLKLLAGLLGVNYDDLKQRDRERRIRRTQRTAALAGVCLALFTTAIVWAKLASDRALAQKITASLDKAEEEFHRGNAGAALVYLAIATEKDPGRRSIATDRLWFALTQAAWPIPVSHAMTHADAILSAASSPDGVRIVTASRDKTARVWDANTGAPIGRPLVHPRLVRRAIFTPDAKSVITIGFDGVARCWNAESGEARSGWRIEHNNSINSVAVSSDGKLIATGSADGAVRVSELATARRIVDVRSSENVHTIQFDPIDPTLLLTLSGKAATLWKLPEGKRLCDLTHDEQVNAADFAPDGKTILTASDDKTCRLWRVTDGKPVAKPLTHDAEVRNAIFSPDGSAFVTLAGTQAVLWKMGGAQPVQLRVLQDDDRVRCVSFASDGLVIFTGTEGGRVQGWSMLDGKSSGEPIRASTAIVGLSVDPGGNKLLVTTADNVARLWRMPSRNPLAIRFAHQSGIQSACLSGDGQTLLTTSDDKTARLWKTRGDRQLPIILKHGAAVLSGVINENGEYALTGSVDQTARLWRQGELLGKPLPQTAAVSKLAMTRKGDRAVIANDSGMAQLWDVATQQPIGRAANHGKRVRTLEYNRDESLFVTGGSGNQLETWNAKTGETTGLSFQASKEITAAHFSPSEDLLAAGAGDGAIYLWSTSSGKLIRKIPFGSTEITALSFSSDGRTLAAASGETATVFRVSNGQQFNAAVRMAAPITALRFNPDATLLATGDDAGIVRVWDVATGRALTEPLSQEKRVRELFFSPDGLQLFASSRGCAVEAWDVSMARSGAEVDRRELAKLARAIAPWQLDQAGQLQPRQIATADELAAAFKGASSSVRTCAEWLLSGAIDRRLSPNDTYTVADVIIALASERREEADAQAQFFAAGDPKLRQLASQR